MENLMDHFVTVDRLPADFNIPADLGDRLRFDPQAKKLHFRGYMSKADFDRLCQLTRDWPFKRKLEDLFQVCIDNDDDPPNSAHRFFSFFRHRAVPS
jgi:hypothetical protein